MTPPNRDRRTDHFARTAGRRLRGVLLVVVIYISGCAGTSESSQPAAASTIPTAAATATTAPSVTPVESTVVEGANDMASPARVQLDWVVSILNDGGQLTAADVEMRFSPEFLDQVPADEIIAFLPQVFDFAESPYTVERFEASADGTSAEAVLLGVDDRRLSVGIAVAAVSPNLIEGLGITPTDLSFPAPISLEAIDASLAGFGPQSSLGVYNVTSGSCTAVHEIRTDSTIVLGSVFKLWVLAALAQEIDEGGATWDETMAVTDQLRSSPTGEIYQLETGTEVTLQRLAEAMISISDNTATDMLIDRLGRPAVEATFERVGVVDPSANVPLLSTGNLFALKFAPDAPNAEDYRALDETAQRSLLDDLDAGVQPWVRLGQSLEELADSTNANGVSLDAPRDLDIEWFATAADLCRTFVHLNELAETPGLEPVASILEISSGGGLPFDRDQWPAIRFKGGSEPGVVAGAWWFEGSNGDRYVLAGGVANPNAVISELDAVLTIASAIELIE